VDGLGFSLTSEGDEQEVGVSGGGTVEHGVVLAVGERDMLDRHQS